MFKLESGELRKIAVDDVLAILEKLQVNPREFFARFFDELGQ